MKIIAKGSFSFGPGVKRDGTIEKFETKPGLIMDMPDKFANDDLFKDCVKFGLVSILGASHYAEVPVQSVEDEVDDVQGELDQYVAEVRGMNHDQLVDSAEQAGIELTGDESDKQIKKILANAKKKQLGI